MKKTGDNSLIMCKSLAVTLSVLTTLTCVFSTKAGVPVGQSSLIDTPDYSDSFTVNTASRPGISHYTNPDAADAYYNVESSSPAVQWHPTQNFSFNTDANAVSEYPGNTGNSGAATGMAQTGRDNFNFQYGVRDTFVIQADANFTLGADHIKLGTYANVGDQSGSAGSLVAYFRRGTISLVSTVETSTGINTGIDGADTSWHNLAVEFNKSANTVSFFVDEVLKGSLDLTTFAGGAYLNYSNGAVGAGVSGYVGWIDNFQVGAPKGFIDGSLINVPRTETINVTNDNSITTLIDAGRLVKQGAGTLSITNAHFYNGTIEVEAGTLEIGSGTSDLPPALRSGLAFWVDANRNVETSGSEVTCWYDVREASGGPTYPMARRFVSTNDIVDPGPTLVQGGDDVSGLKLVDFGAYGSGKWLQWQDAESNRLSIANIRTVFMVVSCTNGTGFLLGDWDNTSTNINEGTGDFYVGGATGTGNPVGEALKNASWWNPNAPSYVVKGQTFINGEYIYGAEQIVSSTGEMMSIATLSDAQASNFGNNRNYKASQSIPGVEIDRQGGGRIGEVLIYSTALTESQRCQVDSYLMKKWFGNGLGTLQIAEGAEVTLRPDATNNLSKADITGTGTLNLQGSGMLDVSEMDKPVLPPVRLAAGSGINSGTLRQHTGQPFILDGGSIYTVANGVSSRSSLVDTTLVEKQGDGVLTASSIADGVTRISVHSGSLRLAPALPDMSQEITNALDNANFETHTSVGTDGTADWGYTPTGTGWSITEDRSAENDELWSSVGLVKPSAVTPWCQTQPAPDGEWCVFLKRAGELERSFTIPAAGRYEISFYTAARPNYTHHLYQVIVDTTNIIASIRTVQMEFSKITCTTPYLSAGTHTLCFKGFYDTSDRASVIDAIVIASRDTTDYVAIPSGDFEDYELPAVNIHGNDHYFEYNPTLAGWNFTPDPAVTNSGISSGHNPWFYSDMKSGGQAVFIRQTGGVSTSVTFPTSGVYRLTFEAAARAGSSGDSFDWYNQHDFDLTLGGNTIARIRTLRPEFATHTYVLPLIKDGDPLIQTLKFTGINTPGGDRASIIDNIKICRMPDIANPSFETSATLANGTWEAGITGAGWSFDLGADETSQSGIAQTGSAWGNTAPEGGCNAFLQMTAKITQTLTFDTAGTYELSFLAAGRSMHTWYLNHDFQVKFNGLKVGYVQTVDGIFRRYTFRLPYVKADTPYELAFEGINHGDTTDRASFIDSVTLAKVEDPAFDSSAFPETELALSSGTTLELDYEGMLTMERVTYNGRSYAGVMTEDNTPFIKGTGDLYATPQGTIIILK